MACKSSFEMKLRSTLLIGSIISAIVSVGYLYWPVGQRNVKPPARRQDAHMTHLPARVDATTNDRRAVTARTDGSPRAASDRDRAMTRLMDTGGLSGEYGELMRRLHADGGRDEKTRNFAIQHLGHYARERRRLGYIARPPASRETGICAIGENGRDKRVPPVSCPH